MKTSLKVDSLRAELFNLGYLISVYKPKHCFSTQYRIVNSDAGYDSGVLTLSELRKKALRLIKLGAFC